MTKPFDARAVFLAGTISHGLLGLAQHRPALDEPRPQHTIRRALQGGVALGAGALACNYLTQGRNGAGVATALLAAGALLLTTEKPPGWLSEQQSDSLISRR